MRRTNWIAVAALCLCLPGAIKVFEVANAIDSLCLMCVGINVMLILDRR